jgi:hypothetical protein
VACDSSLLQVRHAIISELATNEALVSTSTNRVIAESQSASTLETTTSLVVDLEWIEAARVDELSDRAMIRKVEVEAKRCEG